MEFGQRCPEAKKIFSRKQREKLSYIVLPAGNTPDFFKKGRKSKILANFLLKNGLFWPFLVILAVSNMTRFLAKSATVPPGYLGVNKGFWT